MKSTGLSSDPVLSAKPGVIASRRVSITAFTVLTALLCSGSTAPTSCNETETQTPSTGQIVAIGFGVGIGVALLAVAEVDSSHHTLQGCVITGPNGLLLRTSDSKVYAIEGELVSVKVGDKVKFHGSKVKKTKDGNGDQVFKVEKITKNYGPCKTNVAQAPNPAPAMW